VIFLKIEEENNTILKNINKNKKIIVLFFIIYFLKFLIPCSASELPPSPLKKSQQLLLVLTPHWHSKQGILTYYERASIHQPWHSIGHAIPVVVGKNGMAWGEEWHSPSGKIKQEGDERSPAGIYTLGRAFGFAPNAHAISSFHWPYISLKPSSICVDDETSPYYNQLIDIKKISAWNPRTRGEHMLDFPLQYSWGTIIDYNKNNKKNSGSCIFMHVWKKHTQGTAGCVAMAKNNLITLLRWLNPAKKPVIVLFPKSVYDKLQSSWSLPEQ